MNEVLRQRLVGLAVVLLLVFLLSLLLPGKPPAEALLPATTVSLTGETLTEADAVPPPDDLLPEATPEAPPVDSSVAISALADAAGEGAPAAPPESAAPPSNPSQAAGLKLAPKVDTAVLTPPDIVSQLLLGIPLVLLYELALIAIWFTERKRKKEAAADGQEVPIT